MIELLNARFANAWVLARDLEALRDDASAPAELRALARALRADYQYPVDTQIRAADGRLLEQMSAHDLLFGEPPLWTDGSQDYLELLRASLGELAPGAAPPR